MKDESMRVEMDPNTAGLAVGEVSAYRALKSRIGGLEAEANERRKTVGDMLAVDGRLIGAYWEFPGVGVVRITKGRETKVLDRARLARAGVSAEVLDAATVTVTGPPVMRIEGWKESGDADGEA